MISDLLFDVYTLSIDRYQDLRLLLVSRCIWAGLNHGDHDLAAWVASARNIVFLAVDYPFVTV